MTGWSARGGQAVRVLRRELREAWRAPGGTRPERPEERRALQLLRRDGVVALPAYWTAERCAAARAAIDRVLVEHADRLWVGPTGADRRAFGADRVASELRPFQEDGFVGRVLGAYEGGRPLTRLTLGARLDAVEGNPGSGKGWHRDQIGRRQSKAMLYLSDVSLRSGPFQYLLGSHRPGALVEDALRGMPHDRHRYADAEAARLLEPHRLRLRTFTARAGTLLLFDSRGLHRGSPIREGSRYALTAYCYPLPRGAPPHIRELCLAPAPS